MPKYFETSSTFNFTWEQVAQGFWRRYPNPMSSHVLSEDTLTREIIDGRLHTRRLLTKTNLVPKWGARFVGSPLVKIYEESIVDPVTKTLITYTYNIMGYTRVMSVVEKVVYQISEDNPGHTIARRQAWVDSKVFGFSRAIQAFGVERFRNNCGKMVSGFNHVLNTLFPPAIATSEESGSVTQTATNKLKEVAKTASETAKAKADTIYNRSRKPNTQG